MCTLTIVTSPNEDWTRLVFNRDEQKTREIAVPPSRVRFGGRQALLPLDSKSKGTWIAVNDAALSIAILNLNLNKDVLLDESEFLSRGTIVTSLLEHTSSIQATQTISNSDLHKFMPFRLVCTDPQHISILRWDGQHVYKELMSIQKTPFFITSSGLGDHMVETPRRSLFDSMIYGISRSDLLTSQDAFHRHRWEEHPDLSVLMERKEACTVSQTSIEIFQGEISMKYMPMYPQVDKTTHHRMAINFDT